MAEENSGGVGACWKRWKPFLLKHFLPIGLVLAIILGLSIPQVGIAIGSVRVGGCVDTPDAADTNATTNATIDGATDDADDENCVRQYRLFETIFVCIIFLISGLTLKTDDVKKALRAWPATLYGVTAILFITPLLALVPRQLTFLPGEFQVGFLLFCCMPTTINSGVALAQAAKGNFAVALLLTVASNFIGIFTAPFFLSLLLSVSGIEINPLPLLTNLMLTLLLPLLIGKSLREVCSKQVLPILKKHKQLISNISNGCLCCIPWIKLSSSQAAFLKLDGGAIVGLILCGLLIHAIYLCVNFGVATYVLRLQLDIKKSVVIMGSQKTLPMAMTVLSFFPPSLGEPGLIAIPCILSHLTQIFADAFLAAKWALVTDEKVVVASKADASAAAPAAKVEEEAAGAPAVTLTVNPTVSTTEITSSTSADAAAAASAK